jgi:NAD(P)-dependent dehydrogenase (short-subunit alcohol dehydrogenase family)
MDTGLAGKGVIITGGATGIGRATAVAFAREGARLALVDLDTAAAEETARACGELSGATTATVTADLADGPGVADGIAEAIAALGGEADVLVNNVGTGFVRTFDDITDEDWIATLNLNFLSYVRATRAVLPRMRERGTGVIVNNASDLARQPEPNPIDYAASKAAILAITTGLARAEGPSIRINAVAPGPIWTPFWTKPGGFAETMGQVHQMEPQAAVEHEMRLRALPLGRLGEPEEVANVIVFLASDLSSFVTSSVWGVDGGSIRGIL